MSARSVETSPAELAAGVVGGDRRAAARLITWIESGRPEAREALRLIHGQTGRAHLVGVTGPPGAGKSTLVAQVVRELRRQGRRVGVVALDPSSPYTGGALLGDRIRMQGLGLDPGVFIRSMATRGALGGLAAAAGAAARVLDAAGCDVVLLETVGAGQADTAVAELVQSVVVVLVPELGDEVQAIKAGLLETADVLVVNKADLPGAERAASALRLVARGGRGDGWTPPIVLTAATTGQGVPELVAALERHLAQQRASGLLARRAEAQARRELEAALCDELLVRLRARVGADELARLARRVAARELDATSAARSLLGPGPAEPAPSEAATGAGQQGA